MKVIAIIALLVAVASANPMRQSFSKSVGDIWSDCSEWNYISIRMMPNTEMML